MHTHKEQRLIFLQVGPGENVSPIKSNIIKKTTKSLKALQKSMLPSDLVKGATEKVVQSGLAALNIALFASVFATGFYMILKGEPPPQLRHLLGKST